MTPSENSALPSKAPAAEDGGLPPEATEPSREFGARRISARRRRFLLKAVVLVAATSLSLFGTFGQFFFVDALNERASDLAQEMRQIEARVETLRTTQTSYFNAHVQGSLLFALDPSDQAKNKGVVGNLYQLAMYDRAFPFRAILGELAMTGAVEFAPVNGEYNRLLDRARADLSFESYAAVGEFEQKALDQALALQHRLQERYLDAQIEKAAAEAIGDRRKVWMIAMSTLATCLFLAANLIGDRR